MRRFRIRALLATAAGFAALPIVGPLMSVIRDEWDAEMGRGDRLEREADAASARADAYRVDLERTKKAWASSNRLVVAQMAEAKSAIDTFSATIRGLQSDLAVVSCERDELVLRWAAVVQGYDPVRDWPQTGVSEAEACSYCGKTRELGLKCDNHSVCGECYRVVPMGDIRMRAAARMSLKSAATEPKSST